MRNENDFTADTMELEKDTGCRDFLNREKGIFAHTKQDGLNTAPGVFDATAVFHSGDGA